MKNSIKRELAGHILEMINYGVIDNTNTDDWHFLLFNQDYYLIGTYKCEKWLEGHNISAFEAISICQQYEEDNFGVKQEYNNAEKTVNMLAYIYGEKLLSEFEGESVEELREFVEDILG